VNVAMQKMIAKVQTSAVETIRQTLACSIFQAATVVAKFVSYLLIQTTFKIYLLQLGWIALNSAEVAE
jgi:hypothetical protein